MKNRIKRLFRSKIISSRLVRLLLLSMIIFLSSFGGFSLFYNYKEIANFAVCCMDGYGLRMKLVKEDYDNCREQYHHLKEEYREAIRKPDSLQKQLTELERLIDKNKIKFEKIIKLGMHGYKKELIAHTEDDNLTTIRRNLRNIVSFGT